MGKSTKNKIIMVNSFKGGTGKTSVALSNCVHYCTQCGEYQNIYFIDIDRLGTSMSYALFPDDAQLRYFDEYSMQYYDRVCNKVLADEEKGTVLHAVLLNPVASRRQDYDSRGRLWQHPDISSSIFSSDLLSFMNKCMSLETDSLFVVDCSPGLGDMERYLMDAFYGMRQSGAVSEIEELFVTTFDASQIRKTVECLNDAGDFLHKGERDASIVLNDIHNWQAISRDYDDHVFDWRKCAEDMLKNLKDKSSVKVRYKKFEPEQVNACMIGYQKKLIDNIYAFVLPLEYREEFYVSSAE